jgi:hypothetical protein
LTTQKSVEYLINVSETRQSKCSILNPITMKKLIFMLLLTMVSSIAISSCTEEAIHPTNTEQSSPSCCKYRSSCCENSGGTGGTDDI